MKPSILLFTLAGAFCTSAFALDPLSYAQYDKVKTRAVHLDLAADFTRKTLSGYAELTLDWLDPAARTLDLDTRGLAISRVQVRDPQGKWAPAPFKLDALDPEKGQALHIALTSQPGKVRIDYRTSPDAAALQWLTPAQTLSGKRPFMFSQSQSINARSWVPLQDTPAVRFTYTARIAAPSGLRVVMSADNDAKATGMGGWKFKMPQPIPASANWKRARWAGARACMPSRSASRRPRTNWPTPRKWWPRPSRSTARTGGAATTC
jgi:leukotriene-A4 hydrolase